MTIMNIKMIPVSPLYLSDSVSQWHVSAPAQFPVLLIISQHFLMQPTWSGLGKGNNCYTIPIM